MDYSKQREDMLATLKRYKIRNERVMAAMARVRRHVFIPEDEATACDPYGNHPCAIGHGQTISQPYIVAYMSERLGLCEGEKVLEIGSGSGYQAAVLAELGVQVYSLERIGSLAEHAARVLKEEGYDTVHVRWGDGYEGWEDKAPFDAIIGTCAPVDIPAELVDQLAEGGRMIFPVGTGRQKLVSLRKRHGKVRRENDIQVRFVPMVRGM